MSSSGPRREVAYRVFADEFNDATHTYAESDEERAPNYLVTPTGARVNRLFVVGVLTEVEEVSDDVVRARVVDPTGAFVIYAGQYQPDALAFFERADPPAFVAVTGKARTFQPEGSDRVFTSIRPETVNEVDAETRDRWVVQTAEHTLERVAIFAKALDTPVRGAELEELLATGGVRPGLASGIPRAIEVYGTTTGYLDSIQSMAVEAAKLVADEVEAVEREDQAPDEGGEASVDTSFADDIVLEPAAEGEAAETAESTQPDETIKGDVADKDAEVGDPHADQEAEAESVAERTESETVNREQAESDDEPEVPTEPPAEAEAVDEQPPGGDEEEGEVTDEMYELSEEERKEVKEQYDVEFESGAEIGEPESETTDVGVEAPSENGADEEEVEPVEAETGDVGSDVSAGEAEAGVETEGEREESLDEEGTEPEAESAASDEPEAAVDEEVPTTEEVSSGEPAEDEAAEEPAAESAAESPTEAAPLKSDELEDVVIETMKAEGGSDGIERSALIEHVESEYGVEADEIEEAIQDALLGGRCFESGEDRLKPI